MSVNSTVDQMLGEAVGSDVRRRALERYATSHLRTGHTDNDIWGAAADARVSACLGHRPR